MSKISPLGQSMAALFTPEGEKLRHAQKDSATQRTAALNTRGQNPLSLKEGAKSQDSLGSGSTPGYEAPAKKKKTAAKEEESGEAPSQAPPGYHVPGSEEDSEPIRLETGWDKLLFAQKKICEKAKGLFTNLEAPLVYRGQKKSSILQSKSRGAILDVDLADSTAPPPKDQKKTAA